MASYMLKINHKTKKLLVFLLITIMIVTCFPQASYAFTRIVDLVFDGMSVEPDKLSEVLDTVRINKIKNKNIKISKKRKPDKLFIVQARQEDSKNIQLEIDTSEVIVKSSQDIQGAISNKAFLDAISEAVKLWDDVDIADVTFAPLKFGSGQANFEDGRNIVTFRAIETPEGTPEGASAISIITYARTNTVLFMNKLIMVKPGSILDADIIYDPTNNPCLALHTTQGSFKAGGDNSAIVEGGVDSSLSADDLKSCKVITAGDLTDLAVRLIANVLGLESSAIASAATSPVGQIMTRYALTSDDKIGLANIYPNTEFLTTSGELAGEVTLNNKKVKGAHVVVESTLTGEPVASTITNLLGQFIIKAIPAGIYNVYAEPLDGPARSAALVRNFFAFKPDLNLSTGLFPSPVKINANEATKIKIEVKELSASAFNINYLTGVLTEADVNKSGGAFLLPIRVMPGETLTDVQFWGSNISPSFGTLSVSGSGITVSNVREDKNISISPFIGDPPPDVLPGIKADITCDEDVLPGPRNIIFTGNMIDITHPSFGLRDQITGGLFVVE